MKNGSFPRLSLLERVLWFLMPLKIMLMFFIPDGIKDHVAYLNPCCSLETMLMSRFHVSTRKQMAVYDLCCCRLRWARRLLLQWNQWLATHNLWETLKALVTYTHQKETVQPLKRVLKFLRSCWSVALPNWWLLAGYGETQSFSLKPWPLGIWSYMGNTNLTWWFYFFLFCFLGWGVRNTGMSGWAREEWWTIVIGGHCIKIPNN